MTPPAFEVNFDGLVGPSHNYAGLSIGNVASLQHKGVTSNPKKAALEGLAKMKLLANLGLKQAVLPPQERPRVDLLRQLGFTGTDPTVLATAHRQSPALLAGVCSASSMWAANAATVSPSADTGDRRVHFTIANLVAQPHRSIEAGTTTAVLKAVFNNEEVFAHHGPLPMVTHFGDEGAANHTRLCRRYGEPGIELFVYGRCALDPTAMLPRNFPARQTREASVAVARLHGLDPQRTVLAQQNPAAIDAGVFHNDVIAVGNRNVLLYHRDAFVDTPKVIAEIRQRYGAACGGELVCVEVKPEQLSVADAVRTYLFNSQLVCPPGQPALLVCPIECQHDDRTRRLIETVVAESNPIGSVRYVDVRQSMSNGGGPACLRLRVVLTEEELKLTCQGVFLTDLLCDRLTQWVNRHYRDQLTPDDLPDPKLLDECRGALDELTRILGLGSVYPFQTTSR